MSIEGLDIATDTFGPFSPNSQGYKYGQLFLDTLSRYLWLYPMKRRADFPQVLKQFLLDYRTTYPNRNKPAIFRSNYMATFSGNTPGVVHIIRSDCARELNSTEAQRIYNNYYIRHLQTVPYTSLMNGKAERAIQTLNKICVAQLTNANLTTAHLDVLSSKEV